MPQHRDRSNPNPDGVKDSIQFLHKTKGKDREVRVLGGQVFVNGFRVENFRDCIGANLVGRNFEDVESVQDAFREAANECEPFFGPGAEFFRRQSEMSVRQEAEKINGMSDERE